MKKVKKPKDYMPKKGEPFDLDKDFPSGKDENPYERTPAKKRKEDEDAEDQ